MKPLPINQKHALFHAFLKGTDFKEKNRENEGGKSEISDIFNFKKYGEINSSN